jgi:predicted metal-dependent phosphoesterase TrpH
MIDFHTHSSCSDGSFSPEELIDLAVSSGITTIALCDHDTISGLKRFTSYATKFPVTAIPSIEISAEWRVGECHLLGYWIDFENKDILDKLQELCNERVIRNNLICEKLTNLGLKITVEDVKKICKGDALGRPHIAQVLVSKGYVKSIDEAFTKYLKKGASAFVERSLPQPQAAIALLKRFGAQVYLAHPSKLNLDTNSLRAFIQSLGPNGLDGLEVYTPHTPDALLPQYVALANELGLKISGGSDFHGANNPGSAMGYYREGVAIPELRV